MNARASTIRELEQTIRHGSSDKRITTLRRVTDLFVIHAERFDEERIALFDDVIGRLAAEIETAARAELAARLAPIPNAPADTIRQLAHDDAIEVSAPVLERSDRLMESELIEIARTKSQAHLLAISGRRRLGAAVTDLLVERGDKQVAHKVAGNAGAIFSDGGFATLVARASGDERLAEKVGQRIDIPPFLFKKLLTQATDRVRERLLATAKPEMQVAIEHVLSEISEKVGARSDLASRSYSAANSFVQVLAQSGRLGTQELVNFAKAGRFEETVASLAALAAVPVDIVDRVMHGDSIDPLLVLCKAKSFDWPAVRAIILVRRGRKLTPQELESACQDYNTLSNSTADRVLRFWQVRQTG
jgi:uncharacterized protein (DUF2336 family)